MYKFNEIALQNISNVSKHFETNIKRFEPINCNYSIGIEIEIKFKNYYPELFEKYFKNKKWDDYTFNEKNRINDIITKKENDTKIKKNLEKVLELGIQKGNDCYWEFALDPVYDLSIILSQIELLKELKLMPSGDHSLHMTIGNIEKNEDIQWVLMLCEMLFSSKSRMLSGADKENKKTYFKKGLAGLLKKHWNLKECKTAIEFRSLEIRIDNNLDHSLTHKKLSYLSELLNNIDFRLDEIKRSKKIFNSLDLPLKNWGNYKDNPEVWNKYYKNFNKIRSKLKLDL